MIARAGSMARSFLDRGVTFDVAGEVHRRPRDEAADGLSWAGLATPQALDAVSDHVPQAPLTRIGPELEDLAHVAIGMMRHIGIPARYVSGYLRPDGGAGVGTSVPGESHARVEWWNDRWYADDPTNHTGLTDFHVTVARGRDYTDVTPLKGMVTGGGRTSRLLATVEVTRTA